jgi:hypothetical protein
VKVKLHPLPLDELVDGGVKSLKLGPILKVRPLHYDVNASS